MTEFLLTMMDFTEDMLDNGAIVVSVAKIKPDTQAEGHPELKDGGRFYAQMKILQWKVTILQQKMKSFRLKQ